ncbi:hypothetical protein G7Y31_10385 [Corynebacterium lizhenjunii]|uniref:Uncharacterized protein n=1 Tax=Corynebacterium lizhenjunii TaxID=2709394 RepID=A0A7T0KDQ5_9CORY|nr:hypothetical protein [Corynebacterium lizhenjunii]QPK78908.1 hypothetical protein G7Y31_10385 [Corynebacterium lizhenjunii]
MTKATTRVGIAAACVAVSLGALPAGASVVTGDIGKLEVADVSQCDTVELTLIVEDGGAGTKFSVTRLADIDLHTQAGWDAVENLDIRSAASLPTDGTWRATTNSTGHARLQGLPVGAYLVSAEAAANADASPQDFVLTLPVGSETGWDCAPEVHAKVKTPDDTPETTQPRPPYPPFVPPTPQSEPTPTPTPTPRETPSQPADAPRTSVPSQPGTTPTPSNPSPPGGLARTGASVLGVVGLAALLILAGVLLKRRNRGHNGSGQEGR